MPNQPLDQLIPAVAVAVLALALLTLRALGRRRRRARRAVEVQVNVSRGTLAATPLPDLMRTLAEYSASGSLRLTAPGETFTLYFLFGRVFHVEGPGLEGEAALGRALRLPDAAYIFNTKTRLPQVTTITAGAAQPVTGDAVR
jgi:hypothetical protein